MEDKLPFEKIKRNILVKKESEIGSYGEYPEKRTVERLMQYGIVNLNKPSGPTSHQISDYVQGILNINKAGHSGTLDPKVTGVLPIALDKATRIVQTLLNTGKEYVALMHLHSEIDEDKIKETAEEFTGKIKQLPPIKSAVKRQLREREIYYFNILEIKNRDVLFKVGCEAGMYIRKLIHDFAISLGSRGHMSQLVRTKAGPFNDKYWCSLHDLKDAYEFYKEGSEREIRNIILPYERAIEHLPKIWVLDSAVNTLCHGSQLYVGGISKLNEFNEGESVAVLSLKGELICLGKAVIHSDKILKEKEGMAIKVSKVFMERGLYPKEL